jgi:D-amino-acid dehydrogenase
MRACQRPMTPETTPRFGTGRYQNLWFNIGLGHMGFAMAAGAGRVTAEMVCGRTPPIDLEGLRIRRH